MELDPIWAGRTFRKWIVLQLVLMTTPSLVRSLLLQAKFLSRCPEWLCKKLSQLNVTLVEGYPSRSSEAGGLMMDQFLRPAKSQSKWYGLSSDHKADPAAVSTWCTDACKLNSSYSRIARQSGPASTHPTSRRISQETLR